MTRLTSLTLAALLALQIGCGHRSGSGQSAGGAPTPSTPSTPTGQQTGPLPAFGAPGGLNRSPAASAPVVTSTAPAVASAATPTPAPRPAATAGAAAATPAATPTTPAPAPAPPSATVALDRDGDGLSDAAEGQLGTDPLRPDTDGDGVLDGADLAPRFARYGAFSARFPAGAVRRSLEVDVLGLGGRSRVESWLGGWNTDYEGTKGTRSSALDPGTVRARVVASLAGSDYALGALDPSGGETTAPALPAPKARTRFGRRSRLGAPAPSRTQALAKPEGPLLGTGHRTQTQILAKRYTIDYSYRLAPHTAQLRNSGPLAVRDRQGVPLASHTFAVAAEGGLHTDVVLQVRAQPLVAGRPGLLFTVLEGADPRQARLAFAGRVALGAPLGGGAFEARLPLPATQRPTTWTVVAVPVVLDEVAGEVRIAASSAQSVQLAAAARVETALGPNGLQRITVVADLAQLAQPTPAVSGAPNVTERKTLSRSGDVWRATRTAIETRRWSGARATVIETRARSSWTEGRDLVALLAPADQQRFGSLLTELAAQGDGFAVLEARRAVLARRALDGVIEVAVHATQRGLLDGPLRRLASLELLPARFDRLRGLLDGDTVLRGLSGVRAASHLFESVRAFSNDDPLQGGLYLGRLGADTLGVLGKADQARLLGGVLGGAQGFLSAQRAFAAGDHALGLVQVARGSGALVEQFVRTPGVDVSGLVKVALGGVDVAYQLHQAGLERDTIRRQARIERALSAAVDTGLGLIPTVGAVLQAAWSVGFLTATVLDPGLLRWEQVLASPGSLLTAVGTALFTSEIPSAISEVAFDDASRGVIERARELQRTGRVVVVILPEVLAAVQPTASPRPAPAGPAAAGPGKDMRRSPRGTRSRTSTSTTPSTANPVGPGTSRSAGSSAGRAGGRPTPAANRSSSTSKTRSAAGARGRSTRGAPPAKSASPAAPGAPKARGLAQARSRRGKR